MFENIINFFKKLTKTEERTNTTHSKDTAKERLHLVLMQDRANMSADFLELMKQEIIEVIKKYVEVDDKLIDVRLTNKTEEDGSNGAPFLYANIPIVNIKKEDKEKTAKDTENEADKVEADEKTEEKAEQKVEEKENTEKSNEDNKEDANVDEEKSEIIEEENKDETDNEIYEKEEDEVEEMEDEEKTEEQEDIEDGED